MSEPTAVSPARTAQLFAITIDQNALGQRNANVEHEREVAIFDLLDGNSFALEGRDDAGDLYFSNWVFSVAATILEDDAPANCAVGIKAGEQTIDESFTRDLSTLTEGRPVAA